MGCCGCDNKTSTTWGAIIAVVQSIIAFVVSCYCCSIFFASSYDELNEKSYIWMVTYNSNKSIKALLIINTLLQAFWCISSIFCVIGNQKNNHVAVRQWFVMTIIIIICDVILPSILIAVTVSAIADNIESTGKALPGIYEYQSNGLVRNYCILIWSFTREGLISWIANICFCCFAYKRINEIINPQTGFVVQQAYVGPYGGNVQHQMPANVMYVQPVSPNVMYGQQPNAMYAQAGPGPNQMYQAGPGPNQMYQAGPGPNQMYQAQPPAYTENTQPGDVTKPTQG